ncbi:CotH kinase family protein [Melioribacter sp. OK-6-Me]|uniref:CotH kinase family protein n=1 Tax=unclassified Melioribacter TaxID=2627329 RepID=UPI003ED88D8C
MRSKYLPLFLLSIIIVSCDFITEPPVVQNYDLPVYILEMSEENYGLLKKNAYSDLKVTARLNVNGKEQRVKIRHQGFSSRGNFKKNYRIFYEEGCDPYFGCSEVILNSQAIDPSTMRSFLAIEIFKHTDLLTFKVQPVVLYINNTYEGLYYLIEPIDETFFIKRNIKTSELYKAYNGFAFFNYDDLPDVRKGYEKKFPDDKNYHTLEKLISITSSTGDNFPEELEKIFDVDKFLQYWAVTVLICNWDGVIHNFCLRRDAVTNKFEIVPWDLDRTFMWENDRTAFPGNNYLIQELMNYPHYRKLYKDHFNRLLDKAFNTSILNPKIDSMKAVIYQAYNNDRWLKANNFDIDIESENLKLFIERRIDYIKNQLENFN